MTRWFPQHWIQWIGALGAAALAALVIAALVIASGILDLSASIPHPRWWAAVLHTTFKRSVANHSAENEPPPDFDASWRVAQGAAHYGHVCATCHGAPGLGQDPVVLSFRPRPQYLYKVVDQFEPRELFWIVKHGVKYSAMPSWPALDRDDEVWSMVAFLKRMPEMDYDQYRHLALGEREDMRSPSGQIAFERGDGATDYELHGDTPPSEYAYAVPARGFSDFAETGGVPAICERCHGQDGRGGRFGSAPNIAIQEPAYLRAALNAYATGQRHSGIMQPIAAALSSHQIDALADHYAGKPDAALARKAAPPAMLQLGATIARQGISRRGIPACQSCHAGYPDNYERLIPRLDGQQAWYVAAQMRLFRAGGRGDTHAYNPMPSDSHRLEDDEIAAVAAYYAARSPGDDGRVNAPSATGRQPASTRLH